MEKRGNKLIGVYDVQAEVLSQVNELKAQGHSEDHMYVVARDNDQLNMIRRQTDVNLDTQGTSQQQDEGFMGKFVNFLSGDDNTRSVFDNMGLDPADRDAYYHQVENGKILLYVDDEYGDSYQSYSDRTGRDSAVTGTATDAPFATGRTTDSTYDSTDSRFGTTGETEDERLRLHEERLNVDKERVQTGEVNVGKRVVESNQSIEVPVEREEVYIERRPVNEEVTGTAAYEDANDTIHVPLSEERVEVTKKDVVTEEIVVGKRKVQDTETVNETVRREEADIDETGQIKRKGKDKDRF
ncbi:YsnF/AvaK domain-containing protein [Planococcus shenhongbingii]|uniref:YsnF/AvaK domain-containing protein n=1 Tax=Planococcus shenhongbingii TaxID=3058398 RepID=A0ABT8NB79_9BACL|nr:YsnF/AvaK domain-containing protein [Planococcus sp. N017]MDN7245141.1 YsnF/AvaK domain-containing protein [Planococcus sp. N017]